MGKNLAVCSITRLRRPSNDEAKEKAPLKSWKKLGMPPADGPLKLALHGSSGKRSSGGDGGTGAAAFGSSVVKVSCVLAATVSVSRQSAFSLSGVILFNP